MCRRGLFLSLFLVSVLVSINAQARLPIEIVEYLEDARVIAFIDADQFDESMQWNPLQAPPPVTIAKAIDAVKKHMTTMGEISKLSILEIELKPLPHHEKYWHYLVKLNAGVNNEFNSYYFVVLMNGKTIPALKETESIK